MPINRRLNYFEGVRLGIGRLEESMTVQLRRVDLYMSGAFKTATEQEQLPVGVISSLALIVANPGISQNEICQNTGIDKSSLVAIIDYLEEAGWIERHRSREDRRRYALRATPAGETRLDRLIETVRGFEDAMLASVSQRDLAILRRVLDRMLDSCRNRGATVVRITEPPEGDEELLRKAG
jgi:DNA-binding MarR family transcriptional regulator